MYLDISGCIWSYLDVPRHIWSEMAESSLRYCILFSGSDRTYLDIPRHIWMYLDISGHTWKYLKDEYKYEVNGALTVSRLVVPHALQGQRLCIILQELCELCLCTLHNILLWFITFCSILQYHTTYLHRVIQQFCMSETANLVVVHDTSTL